MERVKNADLKRRIIDISYRHKLSHLGSNLTAVDIIDEIFQEKNPEEKFVLSSGHAGLALYVVIEKHFQVDAESIFNHHGVHPDKCNQCHLDCSTGSLGQGLPIAVGMALADRKKNVYCLISDGELAEGSIWEALFAAEINEISNLKIYLNFNHYGAYRTIPWRYIDLVSQFPTGLPFLEGQGSHHKGILEIIETEAELPFLQGQAAHYKVMAEDEYRQAMEVYK